jgi:flagellar biogenesis protein FliO
MSKYIARIGIVIFVVLFALFLAWALFSLAQNKPKPSSESGETMSLTEVLDTVPLAGRESYDIFAIFELRHQA